MHSQQSTLRWTVGGAAVRLCHRWMCSLFAPVMDWLREAVSPRANAYASSTNNIDDLADNYRCHTLCTPMHMFIPAMATMHALTLPSMRSPTIACVCALTSTPRRRRVLYARAQYTDTHGLSTRVLLSDNDG
jgi:hypothetical protein